MDFIGSVFGGLTVIGWDGERTKGSQKVYSCHCSECAKDLELFGDAVFKSTNFSLVNRGLLPCGCSKKPNWNADQYRILLNRKSAGRYSVILQDGTKSQDKVQCTCSVEGCGYVWKATVSNLLNYGYGCPSCAKSGYSPDKPGTFYCYLWTNPDTKEQHLKYGITNKPKQRIKQQSRNTKYIPTKLCSIDFTDGSIAQYLEKQIDIHKKINNIPNQVSKQDFPDGYTETLPLSSWSFIANLVFQNTMCKLSPLRVT